MKLLLPTVEPEYGETSCARSITPEHESESKSTSESAPPPQKNGNIKQRSGGELVGTVEGELAVVGGPASHARLAHFNRDAATLACVESRAASLRCGRSTTGRVKG
jgi:hypothetical protein